MISRQPPSCDSVVPASPNAQSPVSLRAARRRRLFGGSLPAASTISRPRTLTGSSTQPPTASSFSTAPAPTDCRTRAFCIKNYTNFVHVVVGQGDLRQKFAVHESLLTDRSAFFKRALTGAWTEAKDRKVNFPEDEPFIFRIYIHLLYTDTIATRPLCLGLFTDINDYERLDLAKLYVLAEKLQDVETKDKTLAAVVGTFRVELGSKREVLSASFVQTIYGGTPRGSMARRLIIDHFVEQGTGTPFKLDQSCTDSQWPTEFLHELLVDVLNRRETLIDTFADGNASRYMEPRGKYQLDSAFDAEAHERTDTIDERCRTVHGDDA